MSAATLRAGARRRAWWQLGAALALIAIAFLLFAQEEWWQRALSALFPDQRRVLYGRTTLLELAVQHVTIVAASLGVVLAIGVPLGVWLTRPGGREFLPLANNVLAVLQTFPPVAVLALAVPAFGFGMKPTLIALVVYGLLPVARNTIVGLEGVPADALEAARGMGMGPWQRLLRVELPLAAPVMLAGVRVSAVYTIGTATVAPLIGAGGLGVPIIAGLAVSNLAMVIEGAVPVAMLALLVDPAVGTLGRAGVGAGPQGGSRPA